MLIDRAAESIITLGGLGVIAAVLGIIAYLAWVVYPLTQPGHVSESGRVEITTPPTIAVVGEYRKLAGLASNDGLLKAVSIDTGESLAETIELGAFDRASHSPASGVLALARADGSITLGTLGFRTEILRRSGLGDDLPMLDVGASIARTNSVVERTGDNQYRRISLAYEETSTIEAPESGSPVASFDADEFGRDKVVAAVHEDGAGSVMIVTTRRSLVGGNTGTRVRSLPIERSHTGEAPSWSILLDGGAELVLIWPEGRAERFSRGPNAYTLSDTGELIGEGATVCSAVPLLGRNTMLVGTSDGRVLSWMLTRADTEGDASRRLVLVREFKLDESPIEHIATSQRDRTFLAGDTTGNLKLWHATSAKLVGESVAQEPSSAVVIAPKLDGFYSLGGGDISSWNLEPGHPTVTLESLFLPVWYEGDQGPSFVYQSTAADDAAEPKLSITPLIFGTLKATVFALIFAVPVAVMAAIYSSEFLPKQLRTRVKPAVEMMASLPSVVLGFIAAMILAPFVRDHLSSVLVGLVIVPIAILIASSVWPLLPGTLAWRLPQWVQLTFILVACVIGVVLSAMAGPTADRALFSISDAERAVLAGSVVPADDIPDWASSKQRFTLADRNRLRGEGLFVLDDRVVRPNGEATQAEFETSGSPFKVWLTGLVGSPVPGWVALLFVPSLAIGGMCSMGLGRQSAARWLPLARVLAAIALAFPIAMILAKLCVSFGWDPRESVLGTFSQRNTLVVGVIMGFAIIPIIFTLSDDAMQSVPNALRAASLGAGATQWQTTMRIVLPVAASGIFSAIMIGLGRAAGETMIVLMATGNTPVMDWNIFGGLRTLSANIAVELPEADRGGTHYRVLFLCGVVLFAITFVVNTSAEVIRQHFRKRSAML